jgi:hypothetical protein
VNPNHLKLCLSANALVRAPYVKLIRSLAQLVANDW